ncbi:galactan 5-O-arabinofuranosyltransferase [Actinopolyspora biskrensis]|uniref:Galactan 5-O-arabinofuranosyltransferase n=1 Tax=Actinopolyspora biskrensis TaxID=1470178 RepID=A0A852Z336_9ACTN|nr:arabinofuranosyltransferase [Actinopolyspora biskrensis]NYH78046.1 galactan 5-O-arabinofuranosyltransferase [Actinopolyspora biskrensis]
MPNPTPTGPGRAQRDHVISASRLPAGQTITELLLGTVTAAALSIVLQFGVARLGIVEPSNGPEALAVFGTTVLLVLVFGAVVRGRWFPRARWLRLGGVWITLTTLSTLALALPLQGTRFYYGGSGGDNAFRMQYMTRMAENLVPADMNYANIPPYYPSGWFWLGGRFANLIGWEGWAAYKPYAVAWIAVAGVVAFTLWSLSLPRKLALLAALATILAGTRHGLLEPYAWPSAAWLAPIAVLTWRTLSARPRAPRGALLGIGVFTGFAAITYTLHFGFSVLLTVSMAVVIGTLRVRRGSSVGGTVRELFLRLLPIGITSGVIALVVWLPFLLAGGLFQRSAAQHYLPEGSAFLPLPMTDPKPFGLLCLSGLVWLVIRTTTSRIAQALLTVTAAVYVWFGLSTLALLAETTLLAFRLQVVLESALAVAGTLGLVELVRYLRRKLSMRHATQLTVFAVVIAVTGSLAVLQHEMSSGLSSEKKAAYNDYYPNGNNALAEAETGEPGAWLDELNSTINELTHDPPQHNILLTTNYDLLSYHPYWGFQQETPHYANPLAEYERRAAEIRRWSNAASSDELSRMLRNADFEAPEVFVVRHHSDGKEVHVPKILDDADRVNPPEGEYSVTLKADAFPRQPNVHNYPVVFDADLFRDPAFVTRRVGPYTVIARR